MAQNRSPGVERLAGLGWDQFFSEAFNRLSETNLEPARISVEHNHLYRIYTNNSEQLATVTGKLRHSANAAAALPAVGDWVAIRPSSTGPAQIRALLPRRTCFS